MLQQTQYLHLALINKTGEHQATKLMNKYLEALPSDYFNDYSVEKIAEDIIKFENLHENNLYAIDINEGKLSDDSVWQIKLIRYNERVSLSRGLPIVENFGFKLLEEHPYEITLKDHNNIFVCDFIVEVPQHLVTKVYDQTIKQDLQDAIIATFARLAENDSLNKLVLYSGLTFREISLLRAVAHYLIQTTLPYSLQYTSECLKRYPQIAANFYHYFAAKFNINDCNLERAEQIKNQIIEKFNDVTSLDEDVILKAMLAVIDAMLRTNFYQGNGIPKDYISFKLASAKIPFLPTPIPLYEIFVYSLRFEAIHLRGGKVARGGIRWSDRQEDFRTEVLGLVKAQIVKNSVIVPTGSKGGFVCKKLPDISQREAYLAEGTSCYKIFIAGLLDLTDNVINGAIIPPQDVICYDDDDPYLVVAADKGTASFSDVANEMAISYGFWLGDAFASGGSVGYDHKEMGITAKGAWESVKRHFRHLGINTQTDQFTVIGIGDMAGDVFGNGMLLSSKIKLLAAFNHEHIFIDPNPDLVNSLQERIRLFNLPQSSWANYDQLKISSGGGIFKRNSKAIILSSEIKQWLEIDDHSLSPNQLIHKILLAKADLLYNGGIGTYVKAENQSHEEVKDKTNDSTRINANQLQVKVLAEGGNLGVTQLARVEFAKIGGLSYTDAIDNSAGVDCSDHEVNIKILFADIMTTTTMNIEERNFTLAKMTDEVSELVLRDNYLQTQALEVAAHTPTKILAHHINLIKKLERCGELNRKNEYFPNDKELFARGADGNGLTLPELSVLMAYAKIHLDHELQKSSIHQDINFNELVINYFPQLMQEKYHSHIVNHRLYQQILCNQLANIVINRAGITFYSRFEDEFSHFELINIIRAWWIGYKLMDGENIFTQIENLDNKINAAVQVELIIRMQKIIERTARWILRSVKDLTNITATINNYQAAIVLLMKDISNLLDANIYNEVAQIENKLIKANVPLELSHIMARSTYIPQFLDIIMLTEKTERDLKVIAQNYFYAGRVLEIDWLRTHVIKLQRQNRWQAMVRSALIYDVYGIYHNSILTADRLTTKSDANFIQTIIDEHRDVVAKIRTMFEELQGYRELDLAMLSAATREFINLITPH